VKPAGPSPAYVPPATPLPRLGTRPGKIVREERTTDPIPRVEERAPVDPSAPTPPAGIRPAEHVAEEELAMEDTTPVPAATSAAAARIAATRAAPANDANATGRDGADPKKPPARLGKSVYPPPAAQESYRPPAPGSLKGPSPDAPRTYSDAPIVGGAAKPPEPETPATAIARLDVEVRAAREDRGRQRRELEALRNRFQLADARLSELEEQLSTDLLRDVESRLGKLESAGAGAAGGRLDAIAKRLDALERHASAGVTQRLEIVELRIERIDEIGRRVDALEERPGASGPLARRVDALEERLGALAVLADRLAELERRVAAPTTEQRRLPSEVPGPPTEPEQPLPVEDDLRLIKGIGPKFERALRALGIRTYAQIAALSDDDVRDVAGKLGVKPEKILREGWVASAQRLTAD
jgi:predicted flap endonuclease-1-like 5' DNA nuclease